MNVSFKCFSCGKKTDDFKIHSYSWNKDSYILYKNNKNNSKEKVMELCKHFDEIKLSWEAKYGFFTLGWKVEIYNVSVKCKEKGHILHFQKQTYNKQNNRYEEVQDCCDHVIVYYADENKNGECSDNGLNRQNNINKIMQEIKAAEEKLKKEKEETERLEKEEKMMREKEEREMKERENRRRNQLQIENRKMREIINQQEKENNELNKKINFDTSYIDDIMTQEITSADVTYSENICVNAQKEINAIYKVTKA